MKTRNPFIAAQGGILLLILLAFSIGQVFPQQPSQIKPTQEPTNQTIPGKAVWLKDALDALKIKANPESLKNQIVWIGDDNIIRPVLDNEASRCLFLDEQLRNRHGEITIKTTPGLTHLVTTKLKIQHEGRMRIPEYYCDLCAIATPYPQVCPCCQVEVVFRYRPETQ